MSDENTNNQTNTATAPTPPSEEELTLLTPGERLRRTCTACKLSLSRWGISKSLTEEQKSTAAGALRARGRRISASKKIVNPRNEHFAAVNEVLGRVSTEWQARTHPYIENGVRLIRNTAINLFDVYVVTAREELRERVQALQEHRQELIDEARNELGDLFNEADYPDNVLDKFAINVDYPSVEPPSWLEGINPDLYRQQADRVRQRFEEAAQLGEEVFVQAFHDLISHLHERLQPGEGGERRVFQESTVNNVHEFLRSFRQLYVGDNRQLEQLVTQAQEVLSVNVSGRRIPVTAAEVRTVNWIGDQVRDGMSRLRDSLGQMVTNLPRRRVAEDVSARMSEVEL